MILHGESPCAAGHNDRCLVAYCIGKLRILSGHCRIHREAPGTMQIIVLWMIIPAPLRRGFLMGEKKPGEPGNSMRYTFL